MKVSIIISTYNAPKPLRASLESLLRQTRLPDEVLVADDGSGPETASVVSDFAAKAPFPVRHIWHEDKGFRLAGIRNKAIAVATGDYIIQTDGDIIMERHFIEDHAANATRGAFLCGSRTMLDKDLTERYLRGESATPGPFTPGVRNRKNALRSSLLASAVRAISPMRLRYRGCNMSFWRSDLEAVNGYDESFIGWGCEDHDLVARLQNGGIRGIQLKHKGICFHLWHPSSKENDSFEKNNLILATTRASKKIRAEIGLDTHR